MRLEVANILPDQRYPDLNFNNTDGDGVSGACNFYRPDVECTMWYNADNPLTRRRKKCH